jgi:hypothetical protein
VDNYGVSHGIGTPAPGCTAKSLGQQGEFRYRHVLNQDTTIKGLGYRGARGVTGGGGFTVRPRIICAMAMVRGYRTCLGYCGHVCQQAVSTWLRTTQASESWAARLRNHQGPNTDPMGVSAQSISKTVKAPRLLLLLLDLQRTSGPKIFPSPKRYPMGSSNGSSGFIHRIGKCDRPKWCGQILRTLQTHMVSTVYRLGSHCLIQPIFGVLG